MAIEVFGLRDEGKLSKFAEVPSIRDIFANPNKILSQIPDEQRWNIFFKLSSDNTQDFLPININNVEEPDVIGVIDFACKRFEVEPGQVLSMRSGFGIQILIPLKNPISEKEYTNGFFADRQKAYKNIMMRVARDISEEGLTGEPQLDMFGRDMWARMPRTLNIRGNKKARAEIINDVAEPVDIDLFALDKDSDLDQGFALIGKPATGAKQKLGTEMFRDVYVDMQGKKQLSKIRYYDLVKHFEKEKPYKTIKGERVTYVYDKTHYKLITQDEIFEYVIKNTFDSNRNDRNEVFSIIAASNLTERKWFDDSTFKKINFKNGVLDLKTKELFPHSMSYGFFYCLPYDYDPNAVCPTFDQHLKDITCDDEELQNILLEFMGYAISNDEPWAQKALILTGEGNNGKSTFVKTLYNLVGPGSYSDIKIDQFGNQQNLANIEGKLFNISDETPEKLYKSNHFKNITAGGNETIKRLYVQPYSIKVRAKLIVLCNDLPQSKDTTHGFFRRLLIVPFDRIFTAKDEDPFISQKLESELSGILNRILARYEILLKNKRFLESARVKASVKDYMESNDPIRDWLSQCNYHFTADDKDFVTFTKLYESYKNFCLYNSYSILPTRSFSTKLKQIDKSFATYGGAQRRIGNVNAKGFSNLVINLPIEIDTRNY